MCCLIYITSSTTCVYGLVLLQIKLKSLKLRVQVHITVDRDQIRPELIRTHLQRQFSCKYVK